MFKLHPQLAADCVVLGNLPLCKVLLAKDSNYPWLILVPRRENIREIFQLEILDQDQLLAESSAVSALIYQHFTAEKLNVAALGNMVPQLHIHHIVRYAGDPAWPRPVWGAVPAKPYDNSELELRVQHLRELLTRLSCGFQSQQ